MKLHADRETQEQEKGPPKELEIRNNIVENTQTQTQRVSNRYNDMIRSKVPKVYTCSLYSHAEGCVQKANPIDTENEDMLRSLVETWIINSATVLTSTQKVNLITLWQEENKMHEIYTFMGFKRALASEGQEGRQIGMHLTLPFDPARHGPQDRARSTWYL